MNRFRGYSGVLTSIISFALHAQTPCFNFQKLGTEEGLNNANIFGIEQHQNGLMYFSTQNGIYFYDGYNFSQLVTDSLKSNTLLNSVFTGKDELYLSIREEGIVKYQLRKREYNAVPGLRLKDNTADNLIFTQQFAFLLTKEIKLVMIDLRTGKIISDELRKKDKQINLPYCLYKTSKGRVLLGRSSGIYDITSGKQVRLNVLNNVPVHSLGERHDGKLLAGGSGMIWIFDDNKVEQEIAISYKSASATFQQEGEKPVTRLMADSFGRIWFTSYPDENLYLYQNNMVFDMFEVLGIPPALINCIYRDREQNIWIGTFSEGVYFIQNAFFNSLNFSFNNKNLNINQVLVKGNLLAAATSNGLYALNLKSNVAKTLSKPDEVFTEPVTSITEQNGVLYYTKMSQFNMFPAIFYDSDNSYRFKPVIARQFYPLNSEQSLIADWYANILRCNADGSMVSDTLMSFSYRTSVNALLKYENYLYVATNNGLYRYDFRDGRYINLVRNELNFNINDLALVGNKLFAAHEGGITDVFAGKLIQTLGQLKLKAVKKIKQFNDQIWLGTLDGVFICDNNLNPLRVLNKSDGLLSSSVNDFTFNNNLVSIATARGVSTAPFREVIRHGNALRPVTLSHIICYGETIERADNNFEFRAEQDHLTIFLHSPFFSKPNKQYFRYKINGSEWKYFNNLSFEITMEGGTHVLEISASSDNITWSDATAVRIIKAEKLSEKKYFYLVFSAGGLIMISLISLWRIRYLKQKAKKRLRDEQTVNLLKHQAMNSLLSPHFIFNSLTSIQNYINTNNGLKASEYLAKFSRLIRMIIEKASQSEITLYDELSRLTYYLELEKERFKDKFDYVIKLDEDIETQKIKIPNMIIQPYVENSILHGILPKQEHGLLVISFIKGLGRKFRIIIDDNGIGLNKSREHIKAGHRSLGTTTIQNILDVNSKLNGKKQTVSMTDKSSLDPPGEGTVITIDLEL